MRNDGIWPSAEDCKLTVVETFKSSTRPSPLLKADERKIVQREILMVVNAGAAGHFENKNLSYEAAALCCRSSSSRDSSAVEQRFCKSRTVFYQFLSMLDKL
jgi:hypothetical protein